jgi:hypothetical protein
MVEPMMFFALGALAAGLCALFILPPVHARAVRLATRRLEANIPISLAQIRADKDLLRAEFAVAVWRYERTIEQLKTRIAGQLAELGRLKLMVAEKAMSAPEAGRGAAPGDDVTVEPARPAKRPPIRLADLAKLNPDVERSPLVPGFDEHAPSERFSSATLQPAGPPDAPGRK